jgi:hypothetical protein
MTGATLENETRPWYQQGWPWLLIALPASAVVGGILTIIIAVHSPNALVVDDYYKEGLAINQKKHRVQHASDMQLTGLVRGDTNKGLLTVTLSARQPVGGDTLTLHIIHATRSELDRTLSLQRNGQGNYQARLEALPAGTWYMQLQDADQTWEIRTRTHIDGSFQARLTTDKD